MKLECDMRKIPHYRRNESHANSGFKERVIWQLSSRPMTGRELSALFHMSLADFNRNMRGTVKPGQTSTIEKSEPVIIDGVTDYTYTLIGKARRVTAPSPKPIITTLKAFSQRGEDNRIAATLAAERRARMIAKGLHPFCWDKE